MNQLPRNDNHTNNVMSGVFAWIFIIRTCFWLFVLFGYTPIVMRWLYDIVVLLHGAGTGTGTGLQ